MNGLLSPEFEFLCCLVRPEPDHRRALTLTQKGLNWTSVADLAAAHGVRPHLLNALGDGALAARTIDLKQKLDTFQRAHMVRNLHLTRELLRVANAFANCGIPFATFKGVTLAISLYGDISRREFNDIDLIVHEADVRAAESVLQSCGYRAAQGGSREYREAFQAYQRQYMFKDTDSVLGIDLHWDFSQKGVPFPVCASEIWSTLDEVRISDRTIPILGPDVLAVFLAGHGTKEGWRCLGWVCDFAEFYQQHFDMNWIALWERANRQNCGRSILVGLSLAAKLLTVRVDTRLLEQAELEFAVRGLVELAAHRMMHLTDTKIWNPESELTNLELCETWFDKLNALWVLASTRTTGDYEALPLPRSLWRLYHVTRPFRLASKFLLDRKMRINPRL
jgi:Uncharacterised nucleotidyltransferase